MRVCVNNSKNWICLAEKVILGDIRMTRVKFFELKLEELEPKLNTVETDAQKGKIVKILNVKLQGVEHFLTLGSTLAIWSLSANPKTSALVILQNLIQL